MHQAPPAPAKAPRQIRVTTNQLVMGGIAFIAMLLLIFNVMRPGKIGPTGATGAEGIQGKPGVATNGTNGKDGATGAVGPKGERGDAGPQGVTGSQGPQGLPGRDGAPGATGPRGPQGEAASASAQSIVVTPSVLTAADTAVSTVTVIGYGFGGAQNAFISLNYLDANGNPFTAGGTFTVAADGTFTTNLIINGSKKPGAYAVKAYINGFVVAVDTLRFV